MRRHLGEQVAELAEHAGRDGVTLEREQVQPRLVVGERDVEVVEPEVDQHRLELILGVDGLQQLVRHELADELALGPEAAVAIEREDGFALARGLALARTIAGRGRHRPAIDQSGAHRLAAQHVVRRERARDLARRHAPGVERPRPLLESRIVDGAAELRFEPRFEALRQNPVDFARASPEGEAVEQMRRRLPLGHALRRPRQPLRRARGVGRRRLARRDGSRERGREQPGQEEDRGSGHPRHPRPPAADCRQRGAKSL